MGAISRTITDTPGRTGTGRPKVILLNSTNVDGRLAWKVTTFEWIPLSAISGDLWSNADFFVYADEESVLSGFYDFTILGVTGDVPVAEIAVRSSDGTRIALAFRIEDGIAIDGADELVVAESPLASSGSPLTSSSALASQIEAQALAMAANPIEKLRQDGTSAEFTSLIDMVRALQALDELQSRQRSIDLIPVVNRRGY